MLTKKNFIFISVSAVIAFLLPFLAVRFVNGDSGMAVCFILFFAVNPMYAVICGVFSGKDIKNMWFVSPLFSLFFLLGTWLLFDMGEVAFVYYALIYLALGLIAMAVTAAIVKKRG